MKGGFLLRKFIMGIAACAVVLAISATAVASTPTVSYTGQGFIDNGNGGFILKDDRCGVGTQTPANDGGTGQFANWNGPGQPYETGQGYTVWVLTLNANPTGGVTLHLPSGEVQMYKVGGTWKYASPYVSREDALATPVHATFGGAVRNTQLVVSHGCKAFDEEQPAWCSPGFWRNAEPGAWALTGHARTDLFNATVVPDFYDTASGANPTLDTVLTTPGANAFGSLSGPYNPGLNAFNATGAMLTDALPGYSFDNTRDVDGKLIENCPIDHFGNPKVDWPNDGPLV